MKQYLNEHRIAFDEIVRIGRSKEDASVKCQSIIKLFNEELLPHFKSEEENVLLNDDDVCKDLLDEHEKVYALIDRIKTNPNIEDADLFVDILKGHIKKEDVYFAELDKKKEVVEDKKESNLIFGVILGIGIVLLIVMIVRGNQN